MDIHPFPEKGASRVAREKGRIGRNTPPNGLRLGDGRDITALEVSQDTIPLAGGRLPLSDEAAERAEKIRKLKERVQSGAYSLDPREIALNLLLGDIDPLS